MLGIINNNKSCIEIPNANSHYEREYYKLCSVKTDTKRYNMNGDPKED